MFGLLHHVVTYFSYTCVPFLHTDNDGQYKKQKSTDRIPVRTCL